jgi:hypothetical protein
MKNPSKFPVRFLILVMVTALCGLLRAGLPADWTFESAFPTHNAMHAVWAASENAVYAAGDGGVILRWDGAAWTEMATSTTRAIYDLHGTGPNDVWAVGGDSYQSTNDDKSVVLHYNGTAWTSLPTPVDGFGQRLTLRRVWARSATEVYAMPDHYLTVFRWNGSQWTDLQPTYSIQGGYLEGSFEDMRWVNGLGLVVSGTHGQMVLYNGTTWTLEQKLETGGFSTNILTCVFALDANNVYAGHNWGTVFRRNSDGSWTDLEAGEGGFGGSGQIIGIEGDAANDLVFVVSRIMRHYDGTLPTDNIAFGNEIAGNWTDVARAGDRLFVTTNYGGVFAYDLATRTMDPLTVAPLDGFNGSLSGAVAFGGDDLLLYGSGHYYASGENCAVYNRTSIRNMATLPPGMTDQARVNACAARSDGTVALMFDDTTSWSSGLYYWDGGEWNGIPEAYGSSGSLSFSDSGGLAMANYQGVRYWADLTQMPETIFELAPGEGVDHAFTAVWADRGDRIFAGGIDGWIRHWNGATWTTEATLTGYDIYQILGDATNVYAIVFPDGSYRDDGQLWHRSAAGTWSRVSLAQGMKIAPIALAKGAEGIHLAYSTPGNYFGGGLSFVVRLSGATATPVVDGITGNLQAFAANAAGELFLVGSDGRVCCSRPAPASQAMGRVPLVAGQWTDLGASGVSVSSPINGDAVPFFVAWHGDELPVNTPGPDGVISIGSEFWFVNAEDARALADAPGYRFRFHFDEAALPVGFDPSRAVLLRYDGAAWTPVAATIDTGSRIIESTEATGASIWVIGMMEPVAIPVVRITPNGAGSVVLSWDASFEGTVYSSPDLSEGSWVSEAVTPVLVGPNYQATVPMSGTRRFYVVRQP